MMIMPATVARWFARRGWSPLSLSLVGCGGLLAIIAAIVTTYASIAGLISSPPEKAVFACGYVLVVLPLALPSIGLFGSLLMFRPTPYRFVRVFGRDVIGLNFARLGACLLYLEPGNHVANQRVLLEDLSRAFNYAIARGKPIRFITPLGSARSYARRLHKEGFESKDVPMSCFYWWCFGPTLRIIAELTGSMPSGRYQQWTRE